MTRQRLGFIGERPIPEVIAHARGFVRALGDDGSIRTVLDLGAGGGVPGLVIAHDLPDVAVTMLDRRAKRTDFLERMVRRLGWGHRVTVICVDAAGFAPAEPFDAVVARGFGPPEVTLSFASRLVRSRGMVVISEPPGGDRWNPELLRRLSVERCSTGAVDGHRFAEGLDSLDGLVAVFSKHESPFEPPGAFHVKHPRHN